MQYKEAERMAREGAYVSHAGFVSPMTLFWDEETNDWAMKMLVPDKIPYVVTEEDKNNEWFCV